MCIKKLSWIDFNSQLSIKFQYFYSMTQGKIFTFKEVGKIQLAILGNFKPEFDASSVT